MEKILLSFEVTRQDLQEACRSHQQFQKILPRCLVFGSLWLVAATIKFLNAPLLYNQGFVYLQVAVPLLSFAAFKPRWDAHKAFKQEEDWRISYEITVEEITIYWASVDEPVQEWSEYRHFRETKNLILLYSEDESFQIFPKRAFANPADLEQFHAWASSIGQKDAPPTAPIPQP